MTWRFKGCAAAIVIVTIIASTSTAGLVSPRAAYEGCGGMTEVAIQSGRDVAVMLTGRRNPMAGRAVVDDAGMIKPCSDKTTGGMTDSTILICWYMANRLTNGEHIIMTGAAIIHDACMIERGRQEARGDMAHIAIIVGWHVVRWWRLTWSGRTIMARLTVINDALVIKPGIGKVRGDMAHGAILRRRQVVL